MKNLIILLLISLFIQSCTLKKVRKHHGQHFLAEKQEQLIINKTNKNDIFLILGAPSTKSNFDENIWVYIEMKTGTSTLFELGKEKLILNNVLVLKINSYGLLESKNLLDINDMNKINHTKKVTLFKEKNNTFLYDFLSSLRQKMNDPLGKRKKK